MWRNKAQELCVYVCVLICEHTHVYTFNEQNSVAQFSCSLVTFCGLQQKDILGGSKRILLGKFGLLSNDTGYCLILNSFVSNRQI